nr:truncated spike protein [TGEV spike protein expression construct]
MAFLKSFPFYAFLCFGQYFVAVTHADNFPCSKLTNRTIGNQWNLIETFLLNYSSRLPPNSDDVLGDYFPTVQPWFNCIRNNSNDLYVTLENLKALYWDYATENITWNHRQRLNVVVNGYPYSITVTTTRNFNSAEGAIICICKGSPPTTTTESSLTCNWGSECRLNHKFPICPSNSEANCGNMLYGLQWFADEVVAYLHGASYRISFENQWSGTVTFGDMRATTLEVAGTLVDLWWFNPVYDVSYYRVNNKNGTTVVSNCTDQCASYVANVFTTQPGGFIPSDFSFNNWFLLTNSSTLVSGKLVTKQPLLVNCLWPVPSFEEAASTFCFEGAGFDQCNGAVLNNTVDVIRFNLNFTTNVQSGKGATVFSLNTTGGVTLEISCYTVSDSSFFSYGEIPFGVTDGPRYCYVHYNGTALKYLGTLPPSVKEIAISKWGHFYINGYNFFSTFPIDCISFNLTTGDSDVFWTIAYTSYTEALVQVENTAITKVTYCNSHVNNIKCSQITANLNNGFYPVSSSEVGLVNKSVVLLPSFYTHTIVNITIGLGMKRSGYGQPIASTLSNITLPMQDHNTDVYCIRSDQFSVYVHSTCKSALWDNIFKRNCTDHHHHHH